jgi:hypothetical protein
MFKHLRCGLWQTASNMARPGPNYSASLSRPHDRLAQHQSPAGACGPAQDWLDCKTPGGIPSNPVPEFKLTQAEQEELFAKRAAVSLWTQSRLGLGLPRTGRTASVASAWSSHDLGPRSGGTQGSSSANRHQVPCAIPRIHRIPKTQARGPSSSAPSPPGAETPEEALEAAHARIEASLASEVLTRVKAGSPAF